MMARLKTQTVTHGQPSACIDPVEDLQACVRSCNDSGGGGAKEDTASEKVCVLRRVFVHAKTNISPFKFI